jgi:sulfur-oxidizing protein SoxY
MRIARWQRLILHAALSTLLLTLPGLGRATTSAATAAADPLDSARWGEMRQAFLADAKVVFDQRVKVDAPNSSETPLNVPVAVDASALGEVKEVLVFADFNPIAKALRFIPGKAKPMLGFRMKLQQSTPVRAAALTSDGVWHVNGVWVNTSGGGCTVASVASSSPDWQRRLNEVSGHLWRESKDGPRLRLRLIHPMDTGLVTSIPPFFIEELSLRDADGALLMRIEPFEPVSENPVFTLSLTNPAPAAVLVGGHDNNGNLIKARVSP